MCMLPLNGVSRFKAICMTLFFGIFPLIFTGCSKVNDVKDATVWATRATVDATTKIVPYAGGPDSGIVRTLALVRFRNETIYEQLPMEKAFEDMVVKYLSESCSEIRLLVNDNPDFPEFLKGAPSSSPFDHMTMIEKGREAGLNAILTGGILNLSLAQEDKGILWFRETKEKLNIQIILEAFDTETGAKIFDERFVYEVSDMVPEEIEAFRTGKPALFATVTENLDKIAREMAYKICNALMALPWTGYVASSDNNQTFLSFGNNIGIEPGDILEVYDSGKVVENVKGEKFIQPGTKIGEIRITQMEEKISIGEIISGGNIQAGNPVKMK